MAHPFTAEQAAKIKAALETEPCLHNARHYLNHAAHRNMALDTMAAWLNEVGGKELATGAVVAEVLGIPLPGEFKAPQSEPMPDNWKATRATLGLQ